MSAYSPTDRTTLHRLPTRGTYDRAIVHAILDEALLCHLGFAVDDQTFCLPTTFVRDGERLFVHGAAASRMLKTLAGGARVCVAVSLLDGLVLARSAFHHSMNYRSVVVLGIAWEVTDSAAKARALTLLVDKVSPGRSNTARGPNEKELRATRVLELPLEEVSAKVRVGGPLDDEEDMGRPVWAGVVPIALRPGAAEPDGAGNAGRQVPAFPRAITSGET
jgi:nitroimidazol reductase NimA-like FMN-containing flavoprotein (pyridoxamine 5'-phosphate oxidase superfamily)